MPSFRSPLDGFGIGIGMPFVRGGGSAGVSYSAEATAYFAAMSSQPDATRKGLLDTLISGLKTDGVWTKIDWLNIMAAHDAQAGRVNAKNPAQVASAVNSPTFTTNRGYTGDGATSYLDTGVNRSTAGGGYVQDSCHMLIWCGTDVTNAAQYDCGATGNARINARSGTTTAVWPQATFTTPTLPAATSVGLVGYSRTGAAAGSVYKNGASIGTFTSTSVTVGNSVDYILAYNASTTGTSAPSSYSTRRAQAYCFGSQLSAAEHLAIYNRLATYMTAVGA